MQILRATNVYDECRSATKYKQSIFNISHSIEEGRKLVFNTYSGAVVLIEKTDNVFSEDLVKQGFLVPDDENEIQKVIMSLGKEYDGYINHFTILPTTCCNAGCFYCYEEKYNKCTMSTLVVDEIVEYIVLNISHQKEFVLDWFGGEPLLCVDIIDDIIGKIRKKVDLNGYKWNSIITTNATLFSNELINHAISQWNLRVAHITIDGTEEDHNKRKGFTNSNFNAFKKTYWAIKQLLDNGVYVNLRIHMDKQNVNSFEDILSNITNLLHFSNLHLYITPLFPPEDCSDDRYYHDEDKEELFYKVYKTLLKKGYCKNLFDELPKRKHAICSATNRNEIVIVPDGGIHRCIQEFNENYEMEKFDDPFKSYEECENCSYFPVCLGGCIHNRFEVNRNSCVRNKYIVKPLLQLIAKTIK